jgi:CRISPR system Cascade subunit CasE
MSDLLHLLRLDLDVGALVRRGRAQGLPLRDVDAGYLVHAWLEATLGPGQTRAFCIDREIGARVRILAYTPRALAEMLPEVERYADPSDWAAADWSTAASKPMPAAFPAGTELGFSARVVPTRRRSVDDEGRERVVERDAFLSAALRAPDAPAPRREDVYADWLAEQLGRGGAATVLRCALDAFLLAKLLRRTQGEQRRGRILALPDARLSGVLRVDDPAAFGALLARGLGRHRAFGYGMILLRRPEPGPPC